ncbi:MAG: sigma-54-dependent Fis family transcriptional regulator [Planctomycetaceae bacterium]|nr:sigma-54-dependent Fis family transcriptional regulator [Planctomycetaceae bacterium]
MSEDLVLCEKEELGKLRQALEFKESAVVVMDLRPQAQQCQRIPCLELLSEFSESDWRFVGITDGIHSRSLAEPVFRLVDGFLDYTRDCCTPENLHKSLVKHLEGDSPVSRNRNGVRIGGENVFIETFTPTMVPVLKQLEKIARHNVTLMLIGETGSGKTTLANLMHRLSSRCDGVFHTVACGALPKELIESELFGHTRGAFTGADRSRIGRFEAANGGTLLLDEIDLLGPPEQAKLLRVIETGEFETVGSTNTQTTSARLIVASNVPLEDLVEQEKFRPDLYYRLNVLQFRLPPLRERKPDIIPLALRMIENLCQEYEISIDYIHQEFLDSLEGYGWPGNLRELKNQLRRAVLFSDNRELRIDHLTSQVRTGQVPPDDPDTNTQTRTDKMHVEQPSEAAVPADTDTNETLAVRIAQNEREILIQTLKANQNSRTDTAKALGISRVGLYKKLKKHQLMEEKTA